MPSSEVGSALPGSTIRWGRVEGGYLAEAQWGTGVSGLPPTPGRPSLGDLRDMVRAPRGAQVELLLTLPLQAATWHIEPGGAGGESAARRLEAMLDEMDTPLDQVLAGVCQGVIDGRNVHELVFDVRDGRQVLTDIAARPLESLKVRFDDRGRVDRVAQRIPDRIDPVPIPVERTLVYLHRPHKDPVGVSALEPAFHAHIERRKVIELQRLWMERHAILRAVAHHSSNDPAAIRTLATSVAGLRGGGVVGLAPDQTVDTLDTAGVAGGVFQDALDALYREMLGSVLAGFAGLPDSAAAGAGSYALSRDGSDLFLVACRQALRAIAGAVNRQVFARVSALGMLGAGPAPRLVFDELRGDTTEAQRELLAELARNPSPDVPPEMVDELVVKVAGALGLDVAVIQSAVEEAAQGRDTDPEVEGDG